MVHLDLVPKLTTEAFVKDFMRFIARPGVLKLVVSDNGSTFKNEELKKLLAEYNITWKFNGALAPWWVGFFERVARSTKRCVKKNLWNSTSIQLRGTANCCCGNRGNTKFASSNLRR